MIPWQRHIRRKVIVAYIFFTFCHNIYILSKHGKQINIIMDKASNRSLSTDIDKKRPLWIINIQHAPDYKCFYEKIALKDDSQFSFIFQKKKNYTNKSRTQFRIVYHTFILLFNTSTNRDFILKLSFRFQFILTKYNLRLEHNDSFFPNNMTLEIFALA